MAVNAGQCQRCRKDLKQGKCSTVICWEYHGPRENKKQKGNLHSASRRGSCNKEGGLGKSDTHKTYWLKRCRAAYLTGLIKRMIEQDLEKLQNDKTY